MSLPLTTADRPRIDLRCADIAVVFPAIRGARLVIMDAPWGQYEQRPGVAAPDLQYPTLGLRDIVAHIDHAYDSAADDSRLALWGCWPLLPEILDGLRETRWKYKTGGSWHKMGPPGIGYHWRGHSEYVLIGVKGSPGRARTMLRNSFDSIRQRHSQKPVEWQSAWIAAWTDPGDLVLDTYAGLGSVAIAAAKAGRTYVGAEIDPERHAAAMAALIDGSLA